MTRARGRLSRTTSRCSSRCLSRYSRSTRILKREGVPAPVEEIMVADLDSAERLRFLGSPTVRVDGLDVEPAARDSRDYVFACRTYRAAGRTVG